VKQGGKTRAAPLEEIGQTLMALDERMSELT